MYKKAEIPKIILPDWAYDLHNYTVFFDTMKRHFEKHDSMSRFDYNMLIDEWETTKEGYDS